MSYAEKAYDRTPFIPASGLALKSSLDSVYQSFHPEKIISTTPDNLKKYRDSYHQLVGTKQLHPGYYDDNKDYENLIHGKKTESSLHVADLINGQNPNGNKFFMDDLAEQNYASAKREPLGKSIVRNYNFPEICKSADFKFGIPTKGICNAKDIIYSGPNEENDYVKKLYYKSHGITSPGQQNTRYYNWNFDPNNHVFGYGEKKENDAVLKSLRSDFLLNPYPQTKLIEKRAEDFRIANEDLLGKGKFHGTLNYKYFDDENHIFGQKSKLGDAWNVGRCIHGDESTINKSALLPDEDLGKSCFYNNNKRLKNCKSQNLNNDEIDYNRVYGTPSIRRDLPKPKRGKSVCDFTNYGDEPDAFDLLYPHPGAIRGVYDEDFEKLLTKEEIYNMMKRYEFIIPENEYDLMFDVCLKNYPNDENKISAKAFINVMRNLKREYQKYRIVA